MFQALKDHWFLATLPRDVEPVLIQCPVDSAPGVEFQSMAWREALDFKNRTVLEAIRQNLNDVIVFSDVDVQFFGPITRQIRTTIKGFDLAGMREGADAGMNGGFYAIHCRPHVADFWQKLVDAPGKHDKPLHDQELLNAMLTEGVCGVTHTLLPDAFWGSLRHLSFKEPEPPHILVNHANGSGDKIQELRRIRDKYGMATLSVS